jgi:hypothetical protein
MDGLISQQEAFAINIVFIIGLSVNGDILNDHFAHASAIRVKNKPLQPDV